MEEIILWERSPEIINACETAVYQALKALGLTARVFTCSEPPLIARNGLENRLPVLEIRNLRWSLHPGRAFTAEELTRLFRRILVAGGRESPERDFGASGQSESDRERECQ